MKQENLFEDTLGPENSFCYLRWAIKSIEIEGLESLLGHVILVNKVKSKW